MNKFRFRRLGLADDPGHYRPSLHDCLEAVLEQSGTLADDVLQGLQTALVPTTAQVGAALNTALARDTIARLDPIQIKTTFAAELRSAVFGGDARLQVPQTQMRFDDFQFLDSEQIEPTLHWR